MTDNHTDPRPQDANKKADDGNEQTHQAKASQKTAPDTASNAASNTKQTTTQTIAPRTQAVSHDTKDNAKSDTKRKLAKKNTEPEMKTVNVAIAGVTYPINCPVHEEEELRSAIYHINDFAMGLKKEAPRLSQENLLVLTCLNLYERIHNQQKKDHERIEQDRQTEALIHKIMQDAQSIL